MRQVLGKCWGCNEEGHTHRECPTNPYVPPAKGASKGGYKGKGTAYNKGGRGTLAALTDGERSGLSLMLSDRPGPGACTCAECVEDKVNSQWTPVLKGCKMFPAHLEAAVEVHKPEFFNFEVIEDAQQMDTEFPVIDRCLSPVLERAKKKKRNNQSRLKNLNEKEMINLVQDCKDKVNVKLGKSAQVRFEM